MGYDPDASAQWTIDYVAWLEARRAEQDAEDEALRAGTHSLEQVLERHRTFFAQ